MKTKLHAAAVERAATAWPRLSMENEEWKNTISDFYAGARWQQKQQEKATFRAGLQLGLGLRKAKEQGEVDMEDVDKWVEGFCKDKEANE